MDALSAVGEHRKPARPAAGRVCVVLHDVAPRTLGACDAVIAAVDAVAGGRRVPVTHLAVPAYHGDAPTPDLERWLAARRGQGDEIALHGWSHRDDRPVVGWIDHLRRRHYTRSEGEFWSLPAAEAAERIARGRDWFERNGWPLQGFVAPAWLLGPGAWQALAATPFTWTATLRDLVTLPDRAVHASQSVVYSTSAAWRRALSLGWNSGVAAWEATNPILRLELHPPDALHPKIRRHWQRILERALEHRTPASVSDALSGRATRT